MAIFPAGLERDRLASPEPRGAKLQMQAKAEKAQFSGSVRRTQAAWGHPPREAQGVPHRPTSSSDWGCGGGGCAREGVPSTTLTHSCRALTHLQKATRLSHKHRGSSSVSLVLYPGGSRHWAKV